MKMYWQEESRSIDDIALRGTRRDSMFVKAALQCRRTDHRMDIVVRNVSAGGLLADTKQDLPIGEPVLVELRHVGSVPGRIAWAEPGRFGVAFDVSIDPSAVRKPVAATPRPRAATPAGWPRRKPPIF